MVGVMCAVPRNVLLLQQQMKETLTFEDAYYAEEEVEAAVVVAVGESLGESARGAAKAKAAHTKRPPVVTHHPPPQLRACLRSEWRGMAPWAGGW